MGKFLSVLLLLILAGLGVGAYFFTRDMTAPQVTLTPDRPATGSKREFTVSASDPASGIKSIKISVLQAQKETTIVQKNLEPAPRETVEKFTLDQAGLREGQFDLVVVVTDKSVFNFGAGNTTRITKTMTLDNRAPVISVLSQAHHIKQGGVCGVVYQGHMQKGCQFSFTCDGKTDIPRNGAQWALAQDIAKQITSGEAWLPEVGYSTFYHANYVSPGWAGRMSKIDRIGRHIF